MSALLLQSITNGTNPTTSSLERYLIKLESTCARFDIPYNQTSVVIVLCVCACYFGCYVSYCQRSASEGRYPVSVPSTPRMDPVKNIVIVGASSAGTKLAQSLSSSLSTTSPSHRIILIDSSSYSYWPIAALRAAVVPGWESKVSHEITTANVFGPQAQKQKGLGEKPGHGGNLFVNAKVVELLEDGVRIEGEFEGSDVVPFDILTLATGASQPFPMRPSTSHQTIQSLEEGLRKTQGEIEKATRVLVIGGGPTGIEMAGEILDLYPTKSITLLHRNTTLLDSRFYSKMATTLETKMKARGVELVLGDEYVKGQGWEAGVQDGMTIVKTVNGKSIEADYIFLAAGNIPNTSLLESVDPSALEPKSKLVNVNEFMQVETGFFDGKEGKVFAVGDCANSPGWRSIVALDADAAAAATNILNVLSGPSPTLKPRTAGPRALVIPLGAKDGAGFAQLPLLGDSMLPGFVTPMLKGKTLFVEKFEGIYVK